MARAATIASPITLADGEANLTGEDGVTMTDENGVPLIFETTDLPVAGAPVALDPGAGVTRPGGGRYYQTPAPTDNQIPEG